MKQSSEGKKDYKMSRFTIFHKMWFRIGIRLLGWRTVQIEASKDGKWINSIKFIY